MSKKYVKFPQIFIKIFEKLNSPEIFKVAEVCKHWYNITQHAAIVRKTIVKLDLDAFYLLSKSTDRANFKFNSEDIDFFLKTSRKFQFRLEISERMPEKYLQFTQKFSDNIIDLRLVGINLPALDDLYIKNMKNLINLDLDDCNIPSSLANFISNIVNLKSLRTLALDACSFEIPSILPDDLYLNVTSLKLHCFVNESNVHSLLLFTPKLKTLSVVFSDSNSEEIVLKYLKNTKLTKSLTELYLRRYNENNDVRDVFQLNHLNLKKFTWKSNAQITPVAELETFLSSQMNLTSLLLSNVVINDKLIQIVFKKLLNLRELKLHNLLGFVSFVLLFFIKLKIINYIHF